MFGDVKNKAYFAGVLACVFTCLILAGAVNKPTTQTRNSNLNRTDSHLAPDSKSDEQAVTLPSVVYEFPEVFTWSIPNGGTVHARVADGTIKPVIKVTSGVWCESVPQECCELGCPCYQRSPWSVVSKIVNQYASYGDLYGDSPTIMLQELGMGNGDPCPHPDAVQHWMYADALFLHWCDQIKPDISDPCEPGMGFMGGWLSPWNENGVEEMKTWMQSFLTHYQTRVALGTLPIPERFAFDTEYWPMVTYWGDKGVRAFRDLAGLRSDGIPDERWDSLVLPVYNVTLKQLYDEAVANGMNPPVPGDWTIEENQSWTSWYDGVLSTLCDAAMKEAFFDPIKEVWPDVICSNFDTSISTDGFQSIPGSPKRVFRNRRHQSASWFTLIQKGSSDEQSAEMYCVSELHLQENEEPGLAWSRVHRANIEACMESYEGYAADLIMPWIPLVGTGFVTGWEGEITTPDKWSVRNLLAMFRSKGINKFLVWSTSELMQNWRDFDDIFGQVWLTEVESYSVSVGVAEENAVQKIQNSDWNWKEEYENDVLSIGSEFVSDNNRIESDIIFSTDFDCSQTREMQLMLDLRLEGDLVSPSSEADLSFSLQNTTTGEWSLVENVPAEVMWFDTTQDKWIWESELDPSVIGIDQRRFVLHVPIKLSRYWIDVDGSVRIRLSAQSNDPFTLLVDSATLFETDETDFGVNCLKDCAPEGGDGVIDLNDLLQVISDFETGSGRSDVYPSCGDGKVDIHDILSVLVSWETTCD
ncbi:MAG: hypothetical protein H8E86_07210 [Planctomycetes bacterium]|nr:hypothetical protein [Planctomycetota bacterium]